MAKQTRKAGSSKGKNGASAAGFGGVSGLVGGLGGGPRGGLPVGPGMAPDPLSDMMMPGMDPAAKIADWLERTITRGPIDRLRLVQKTPEGDSAVCEWDREEISGMDAASIADVVYERAADDVNGMGTLSRFAVLAYQPGRGSNSGAPTSRCFFRLAPEDADGVIDTENPARESGMLSQAWRHTEASTKLLLNGVESILRTMGRELSRITEQNEDFAARHTELLIAQQELLDRSATRALAVDRAKLDMARGERRKNQIESLLMWAGSHAAAHAGMILPPAVQAAFALPPSAGVNGQAQPTQQPMTLALDAEHAAMLVRVTRALLDLLAGAEQKTVAALTGRLPAADRELVQAVRQSVIDRVARSERGEQAAGTEAERKLVQDFQGLICTMLGGGMLSDVELGMLLGQIPEEVRSDATKLRDMIHAARSSPAHPTINGAANGATGTNGAGAAHVDP